MMDNVQKHNICVNVTLSQTFRSVDVNNISDVSKVLAAFIFRDEVRALTLKLKTVYQHWTTEKA
jgi:hypothetical protein